MKISPTPYFTSIAFQALNASNVFSSHEEKDTVVRISAIAGLMYSGMESLIKSRVLGHSDTARALEITKRVSCSAVVGGSKGGLFGGLIGGVVAVVGVAAGLAAPPVGVALTVATIGTGFFLGGGASAAS